MSLLAIDDFDEVSDLLPIAPCDKLSLPHIPLGISSASSLAKSSKSEPVVVPQSPQLEPPKEAFQLGVIRRYQRLEQLATEQTKVYEKQTEEDFAELDRLELEKQEVLRKRAKTVQSRDTWGVWKKVSQYVGSGASIALGFAASPVAPVAGGLLIASGVSGIGNNILQDTGILKGKWTDWISLASLALGLAGGIGAYRAGAFALAARGAHAAGIKKTLEETIAIASNAMGVTAKLGEGYHNKKLAQLQARMLEINAEIQSTHQELYSDGKQADNMISTVLNIGDTTKDVVSGSAVSLDLD